MGKGIDPKAIMSKPTLNLDTVTGLTISATTVGDDRILDDFFVGYDRAFVLPNEKESRNGFLDCLALNGGEAYRTLAGHYGAFREVVAVVRDTVSQQFVGGVNFITFPLPCRTLSINLNYIFVESIERKKGYFGRIVQALPELAGAFFKMAEKQFSTLIFIEQNNPFRMDPADYLTDTTLTGLDQLDRILIWEKLGAKLVDFPYVQPALSPAQQSDEALLYGVVGAEGSDLDACLLRDHLERFFAISVLKGASIKSNPSAHKQIDRLASFCIARKPIRLIAPSKWIAINHSDQSKVSDTSPSTNHL